MNGIRTREAGVGGRPNVAASGRRRSVGSVSALDGSSRTNEPAALTQLTQDYMAALQSLWDELIVPRLDGAREVLTSQGEAIAAVPPLPKDPSGFGPMLAWFDDVFEASRGRRFHLPR